MLNFSLGKQKIKILLLEGVHPSAVEVFKAAGYENIDYQPAALPEEQLLEKIAGAHFVGIRSRTQLNAKVFAAAKKLMSVGCFCIGTNQVDLQAATEHGVIVFNAPYSNTRSVAELVIAEAIMLMRGIPDKSAKAHRGEWLKSASNSYEVRGKTLGIVGYGNIGSQISVMAESMGMKVRFYDTSTKLPLGNAAQVRKLHDLLGQSDVISLHVPDNATTRGLMGPKELAAMKPGAMLINAARGQIVDIDSLCEHLASKHIGGAAIDVFPVEPKSNQEEFISPLREFDNVILTPHIGGSTQEAQENIGIEVAEKIVMYSDNGTSTSAVNFPQVALPSHADTHRLLHVHRNIPGMMTAINQIFSQYNINVAAQYLQTNDKVGYVVVDIEAEYGDDAIAALKAIEGTIRCRVLF
ncbi:MAG: D-3-phosphoglycerate dehydrogenase [SAR92 bacterium MED-G29]|mgnify:FL=1|jgi:D-3-phosphoglycerate dehydrogenase|nr:MAG: D-3-phosphoglycerate dehydrogenase [SAR92 bacterium MED-G29]|tara:strand:- start:30661 stop:31890 length:1230 start_codon:yes stop_codon:yes gene_type:complete